MTFELLVAIRYLRAKRKQTVISLITVISIIGVAAGVAVLVIALAMNDGFREQYQNKLLGAQSHVNLMSKKREPLTDYVNLAKQVESVAGVVAASPTAYDTVLIESGASKEGAVIKGVIPELDTRISALANNIVEGSLQNFQDNSIVLGKDLASALGAGVGDPVDVISANTVLTPFGSAPHRLRYTVRAIYSSGLYDIDSRWVYVPLASIQNLLGLGDAVTTIEVKVKDIYQAHEIGQAIVDRIGHDLGFNDWIELNRSIFQALKLERLGMALTIGLIVIVAALNIVATLIMMVLEKTRDIAILTSMGATAGNIRRIFMYQGVIIGAVGTFCGVLLGQTVSFFADKYQLIQLAPDVYAIAYVPFNANPLDSVIIAVSAIFISYLATLYPSAAAARMLPVEALRYE